MFEFFQNERSVWQTLRDCGKPVVLYGMGDGADKVLAAFERCGIQPAAVMASDAFVRGQSFRGFRVQRLSAVEAQFGDFAVALCFASQLPEVMDAIRAVAARLADELSRRVYETVLRFYHTGDIALLDGVTTGKDEAFRSVLQLSGNELYVDLGAYNGDTIDEFLHYTGGSYRKIVALEPNAKNFAKLRAHCGGMENTELWELGAWSRTDTLLFNNKAGRNSAIAGKGVATRVAAVDSILCGAAASYIKADVEGADREALLGMAKTLRLFKPKLNLAAYHRFEDLFRLPLLLHALRPDYKIYLRHHPYIPAWDTNIYAV